MLFSRRNSIAVLSLLAVLGGPYTAYAEVTPFKLGSFAELRAARQGKPFVLMFWAVDCSHCKANMQVFKTLRDAYPELKLVLVAVDDAEQQTQIEAIVQRYALADVPLYTFADDSAWLRREIDKKWQGEVPRTYFFDAAQKMSVVSGRVTADTASAWAARHLPRP